MFFIIIIILIFLLLFNKNKSYFGPNSKHIKKNLYYNDSIGYFQYTPYVVLS